MLRLPERPWVAIFANPYSGRRSNRPRVQQFSTSLNPELLSLTIWNAGQRRGLLNHPQLARYCCCLVVAGGDGTVAAVCNDTPPGAARNIPIAILPLGNENLLAKQFRFNQGPKALAQAIIRGWHQPLDMGWFGPADQPLPADLRAGTGRCFTLMLSVGLDADVVRRVTEWRTGKPGSKLKRVRRVSYAWPIVRSLVGYRYPTVELEADGRTVRGCHAFVFNLPRYAMGLPFAPEALGGDGLLDYVVLEKPGFFNAASYFMDVRRRRHLYRSDVQHGRARHIVIRSDEPAPVQTDGDLAGITPVQVTVQPNALRLILT